MCQLFSSRPPPAACRAADVRTERPPLRAAPRLKGGGAAGSNAGSFRRHGRTASPPSAFPALFLRTPRTTSSPGRSPHTASPSAPAPRPVRPPEPQPRGAAAPSPAALSPRSRGSAAPCRRSARPPAERRGGEAHPRAAADARFRASVRRKRSGGCSAPPAPSFFLSLLLSPFKKFIYLEDPPPGVDATPRRHAEETCSSGRSAPRARRQLRGLWLRPGAGPRRGKGAQSPPGKRKAAGGGRGN